MPRFHYPRTIAGPAAPYFSPGYSVFGLTTALYPANALSRLGSIGRTAYDLVFPHCLASVGRQATDIGDGGVISNSEQTKAPRFGILKEPSMMSLAGMNRVWERLMLFFQRFY